MDEPVPPTIRTLAMFAKAAKVRSVRTGTDVGHHVDVYRNGKRILRVAVPNAEDCLDLMWNAPGAMCADYLVIAADMWGCDKGQNPITGSQWEFGDMDRIVSEDMGIERGLITERLALWGAERDGTLTTAFMPYVHDRERRRITWEPLKTCESLPGGRFPRVAREGFERATVVDHLIEMVGPPPPGYDVEDIIRKSGVSYVLQLPESYRVLEGPKGPPLAGSIGARGFG